MHSYLSWIWILQ